MRGRGDETLRRADLANDAVTQHDDAVGDLRDDGEIVRDVERGRPRSRTTDLNARNTSIWVVTSSAVVGSSKITSRGR